MSKEEIKKECLNQAIRVHSQVVTETAGNSKPMDNSPEAILETAKKFEDYISLPSQG